MHPHEADGIDEALAERLLQLLLLADQLGEPAADRLGGLLDHVRHRWLCHTRLWNVAARHAPALRKIACNEK